MKKPLIMLLFIFLVALSCSVNANSRTIIFPHACAPGDHLLIASVGDVLLHKPLQMKANEYGYLRLWAQAIPVIKKADIAFANVEGPMAHNIDVAGREVLNADDRINHRVYTSYPLFNYNPNLAEALKETGFNVVSTANNHALDRESVGVDRTIEALKHIGLHYSGTVLKGASTPWYTIIRRKGFSIAWIACTAGTNGREDHHNQVLYCYKRKDRRLIKNLVTQLKTQVDAIIITPHWGVQYQHTPDIKQKQFAKEMLDAGALAIIGSHPHVLQPMQKYITQDGRSTFIAYSLGNFVSYQGTPKNRSTVILYLGLTRLSDHKTIINGIRFIPAYMQNRSGLEKIRLQLLTPKSRSAVGYQIIANILPMGNAIAPGDPIVTNPRCY